MRPLVSTPNWLRRHPRWLRQTKRLFPHPLFAGCISLAFMVVGFLFAGVGIFVPGGWPVGILSLVFFAGCFATFCAAIAPPCETAITTPVDSHTGKPTFAIFVLLIGVYSWLLTVSMHIFNAFIKNGPGSPKYYLTLGIAISASLFMQFYGKQVVREHFGLRGGRNLELTGRQALYITIFVVSIGIYGTWLFN